MNNSRRRIKKIEQTIGAKNNVLPALIIEYTNNKYYLDETEIAYEDIDKLKSNEDQLVIIRQWIGPDNDINQNLKGDK